MRYVLPGLLAGALLLPLTFAADPPGEPDDPPVRLKKKDRPGAAKPEPEKKAEPEKPPEPKPEPKPEAKPGEKDEPDAPPVPEENEDEILERLLKNTKKAQDRLANREVGEGTRQLQRDILDDIEKLIKKSESDEGGGGQDQDQDQNQQQQDKQNQQGKQGQQQRQGQQQKGGMGGGKSSAKSKRQQRQQARRQQGRGQQRPGPGQNNPQNSQPMPNNDEAGIANQGGAGGRSKEEMNKIADLYKDVWGHLPETMRAEMDAYSREKFMAKYKDLIEKYYSNLAEKNRKGP